MGKGKTLTKEEIDQILTYREQGKSIRFIARKIERGATVVHSFIKDPEKYGKNRKGRVSKATTCQERRAILRAASNSRLSVSKIKAKTGVTASRSTVHRVIQKASHIRQEKMKKKPPLNAARKIQRLDFATSNIYDFPIKSFKDLEDLDRKLKSEPQFEADLKAFLSSKIRGKVGTNLSMLISDDFISEINWNGRKKMTTMKSFRFFESTLYGPVHNLYKSYEDYENDIKNAIKKSKNRIDQRKHQMRRIKKHI